MKKLSGLLIVCLLVFGLVGCGGNDGDEKDILEVIKENGKITLGTSPDFAPNEFYIINDKGEKEIVGIDIDLAKAIAEEIGVELEIKGTNFDGVLLNTQSGNVDMAITGIAKTKEREKMMQFSEPYNRSDGYQAIMIRKSDVDKYKSLDELKKSKLIVGCQKSSIQLETAQTITDQTKIKQFDDTASTALALNAGDVDVVTVSSSQAEKMIKNTYPDLMLVPRETIDLDPDNYYTGTVVGFPQGDKYKSLIELINKVIKKAQEDGSFEQWVEKNNALADKEVKEAQ